MIIFTLFGPRPTTKAPQAHASHSLLASKFVIRAGPYDKKTAPSLPSHLTSHQRGEVHRFSAKFRAFALLHASSGLEVTYAVELPSRHLRRMARMVSFLACLRLRNFSKKTAWLFDGTHWCSDPRQVRCRCNSPCWMKVKDKEDCQSRAFILPLKALNDAVHDRESFHISYDAQLMRNRVCEFRLRIEKFNSS